MPKVDLHFEVSCEFCCVLTKCILCVELKIGDQISMRNFLLGVL